MKKLLLGALFVVAASTAQAASCTKESDWKKPSGTVRIKMANDWDGGRIGVQLFNRIVQVSSNVTENVVEDWNISAEGDAVLSFDVFSEETDGKLGDVIVASATFQFEYGTNSNNEPRSRFLGATLDGPLNCTREWKNGPDRWVINVKFG